MRLAARAQHARANFSKSNRLAKSGRLSKTWVWLSLGANVGQLTTTVHSSHTLCLTALLMGADSQLGLGYKMIETWFVGTARFSAVCSWKTNKLIGWSHNYPAPEYSAPVWSSSLVLPENALLVNSSSSYSLFRTTNSWIALKSPRRTLQKNTTEPFRNVCVQSDSSSVIWIRALNYFWQSSRVRQLCQGSSWSVFGLHWGFSKVSKRFLRFHSAASVCHQTIID